MDVNEVADPTIVAAWDSVANAYQHRYRIPTDHLHLGPMVPAPEEVGLALELRGSKVLDYGCGGGQNAIACALAGADRVIGVDPSREQIRLARLLAMELGTGVEFQELRPGDLSELGDDFDLVLSVYALQFVENISSVLRQLSLRLRPGGVLLISVDHPMRVSGEWQGDNFVVEDYFAHGWQAWPYDFPEAGLSVQMRRFRRSTQEWVSAVLDSRLVLRTLLEPRPRAVPDTFARFSKYGEDDPRNVFTTAHLEKVPGSLILVAERAG